MDGMYLKSGHKDPCTTDFPSGCEGPMGTERAVPMKG